MLHLNHWQPYCVAFLSGWMVLPLMTGNGWAQQPLSSSTINKQVLPQGSGSPRGERGTGSLAQEPIPPVIFNEQVPPQSSGSPSSNEGSGSHGELCFVEDTEVSKPLSVLIPEVTQIFDGEDLTTASTRATASHLVFMAYIPYSGSITIELLLNDSEGYLVYEQTATVDLKAGLVAVQIPAETAQKFALNEVHRWYFQIDCNGQGGQGSIHDYVEGDLVMVEYFSSTTPGTVAEIQDYAQAGIWLDTLYLSQQLRSNPGGRHTQLIWQGFLEQMGLGQFTDESLNQQVLLSPELL